jgi:hypothetical protein
MRADVLLEVRPVSHVFEFYDLGIIYHTFICTCFCFATIFSINSDCVIGAYENATFLSLPDFLETFLFSAIRGLSSLI